MPESTWRFLRSINRQSTMLLIRNDFDIVFLECIPGSCFRIILGVDKAEPVLIILSRIVSLIIETGISCLFTILNVTQVSFNSPDTMFNLPGPHELMEVTGSQLLTVFTHGLEKIHNNFQRFAAGLIEGCRACTILMSGFHQAKSHSGRLDIFGVNIFRNGSAPDESHP